MPRRIITDTFLALTGPNTRTPKSRALSDANGNVAIWTRPNTPPRLYKLPTGSALQMRGTLIAHDGSEVNYRRIGVSCTWAICKGKFTTNQVAAWWPADGESFQADTSTMAVTAAAHRTKPVTASSTRAAAARARAARAARQTVAERRAALTNPAPAVEARPAIPTPPVDAEILDAPNLDPTDPGPVTIAEVDPRTGDTVAEVELPKTLADLGMTPRTTTALAAANINTLGDLASETETSLGSVKGIGAKALSEITDLLTANGYALNGE